MMCKDYIIYDPVSFIDSVVFPMRDAVKGNRVYLSSSNLPYPGKVLSGINDKIRFIEMVFFIFE